MIITTSISMWYKLSQTILESYWPSASNKFINLVKRCKTPINRYHLITIIYIHIKLIEVLWSLCNTGLHTKNPERWEDPVHGGIYWIWWLSIRRSLHEAIKYIYLNIFNEEIYEMVNNATPRLTVKIQSITGNFQFGCLPKPTRG